jgi:hypothetical protein
MSSADRCRITPYLTKAAPTAPLARRQRTPGPLPQATQDHPRSDDTQPLSILASPRPAAFMAAPVANLWSCALTGRIADTCTGAILRPGRALAQNGYFDPVHSLSALSATLQSTLYGLSMVVFSVMDNVRRVDCCSFIEFE